MKKILILSQSIDFEIQSYLENNNLYILGDYEEGIYKFKIIYGDPSDLERFLLNFEYILDPKEIEYYYHQK